MAAAVAVAETGSVASRSVVAAADSGVAAGPMPLPRAAPAPAAVPAPSMSVAGSRGADGETSTIITEGWVQAADSELELGADAAAPAQSQPCVLMSVASFAPVLCLSL